MSENDFTLELEENALDSLEHAVYHYLDESEPTFLKYTILHTFHAIELFLKARLALEHPLLIYDAPEKAPTKPSDDYKTVDFNKLRLRLQKAGVAISEDDIKILVPLRKMRNAIEHHRVDLSTKDVERLLGQAMFFLDQFLRKELNIELEYKLSTKVYSALKQSLYTFKQQMELAEQRMEAELPGKLEDRMYYSREICEQCGNDTIQLPPTTSENSRVRCHFCNELYYVKVCDRCNAPAFSSHRFTQEDDGICEDCWEYVINSDD